MRTKLRRRSPSPRAKLMRECDALAREWTFGRDRDRCVRTGATSRLQWCHVRSRRYLSMRWHPANMLTLSAGAHLWWHHNPLEAVRWFEQTYPERAKILSMIAMSKNKIDLHGTKLWLESELRKADR